MSRLLRGSARWTFRRWSSNVMSALAIIGGSDTAALPCTRLVTTRRVSIQFQLRLLRTEGMSQCSTSPSRATGPSTHRKTRSRTGSSGMRLTSTLSSGRRAHSPNDRDTTLRQASGMSPSTAMVRVEAAFLCPPSRLHSRRSDHDLNNETFRMCAARITHHYHRP